MEKFYEKIKFLTEVDPLLLYGFIYVCPSRDFNNLIRKILPYLSISFLAYLLESLQTLNNAEVILTLSIYVPHRQVVLCEWFLIFV